MAWLLRLFGGGKRTQAPTDSASGVIIPAPAPAPVPAQDIRREDSAVSPSPSLLRSKSFLDDHGQPVIRSLNSDRRIDRSISELMGFAKGMLADGKIDDEEILALGKWVLANSEVAELWPVSVILARLDKILVTGRKIEEADRVGMRDLLSDLTGSVGFDEHFQNVTSRLPLCKPTPSVVIPGKTFVFTGKFIYGIRRDCQRAIVDRGGIAEDSVTKRTSYVVLGCLGSADWIQSNFGRKIEYAVQLRDKGILNIIAEDHWAKSLDRSH